nr:retrovirus-related Pol polyprotein from transposon TNT 1-94 [Tanacetum cinerariifolium]
MKRSQEDVNIQAWENHEKRKAELETKTIEAVSDGANHMVIKLAANLLSTVLNYHQAIAYPTGSRGARIGLFVPAFRSGARIGLFVKDSRGQAALKLLKNEKSVIQPGIRLGTILQRIARPADILLPVAVGRGELFLMYLLCSLMILLETSDAFFYAGLKPKDQCGLDLWTNRCHSRVCNATVKYEGGPMGCGDGGLVHCSGDLSDATLLQRSDFASWQQRIRLYCMGKDNGENIVKLIDEGPFKMGKFRETMAEGEEGALHLRPEQDRVFADPHQKKKRGNGYCTKDKNEAKRTKPGTGMERVQEIEAEGKFIQNPIPLNLYP